ncbi:putative galactose oxidase/kelch, beta-propeller, immunoglobulin-like, immunoglobulin E-set [Septoria linicola]|nr:putative galactose oxidase/kelch, beta-propeller, immunoglobulin-like, immunoglobulin E-set [Septoria linicola]
MSTSRYSTVLVCLAGTLKAVVAQGGPGSWGPSIQFPVVTVSGAIAPDTGNLIVWSSRDRDWSGDGNVGQTFSAEYDWRTGRVSERLVSQTNHDMFCSGVSMGHQGDIMVTGGSSATRSSVHDWRTPDVWKPGPELKIPRGYQTQTTLSNGRMFLIGGSWSSMTAGWWSGINGGKHSEIWDPSKNTWELLPGIPVDPILTDDWAGLYRSDNHAWLHSWRDGSVFHAGPSKRMNWFYPTGEGSHAPAGERDGVDAMCGFSVMYDAVAGKILSGGGAPSYELSDALTNSHITTINEASGVAEVKQIKGLNRARIFGDGVILPTGHVLTTGGMQWGRVYTDATAVTVPEIWDPATEEWTELADEVTPRTYHSIGVLLQDGTVFSGGGGLCGVVCVDGINHFDGKIFTPPYLSGGDATRPTIESSSSQDVPVGGTLTVTLGANPDDATFSLVRLSTVTHVVNTDQRRVPLTPTAREGNTYTLQLPGDAGVLLPGFWYLFAISPAGVPSVAQIIKVHI